MISVDISKAKRVRGGNSEQQANKMIEQGWTMLSVAAGKDEAGYPIHVYSLGWFNDSDVPDTIY